MLPPTHRCRFASADRSSATSGAATSTPASAPARAGSPTPTPAVPNATPRTDGYKDISYEIGRTTTRLTQGSAEVEAAPGSASKIVTKIFGNEATGDLNGDGLQDVAFVLTQSTGGSGTFYYAVVALRTATGWTGTNAVLFGDRVAPQTTEIQNGTVTVNYADRKPGEPMTAAPSVGVSKHLKIVAGRLTEGS